jgi:O-antigen ligase
MERYKLMFSSDAPAAADDQVVDTALASSEQRRRNIQQSIAMTAENPLFGVGPGMYMVGAADYASRHSQRADWLETHNTITQVSSETGIPGVVSYVAMLFFTVQPLFGVIKKLKERPDLRDLSLMASAVRLSFFGTLAAGLFASLAYDYYFPLLAGFSVSLVCLTENAIKELPLTQALQPAQVAPKLKLIYGKSNRPKPQPIPSRYVRPADTERYKSLPSSRPKL